MRYRVLKEEPQIRPHSVMEGSDKVDDLQSGA